MSEPIVREARSFLRSRPRPTYTTNAEYGPPGSAAWSTAAADLIDRLVSALLATEPLPSNMVCACLLETGGRQVRIYERCERCHALMESDLPADLDALAAEVRQLREALAIADRDIRLGIREAVFSTPIGKPFTETLRLTIADRCQIAETNIAAALAAEAAR